MDRTLFDLIHKRRHTFTDAISRVVSGITEYAAVWIVVAAALYFKGGDYGRHAALAMVIALAIAAIIIFVLFRTLFDRPRPYVAIPGVQKFGLPWANNSFPSGHVATTVAMVWALCGFYPGLWEFAAAFTIVLMWSRVYNGMHWPSDVAVGALVGIFSGWLALVLLR